MPQLTDLNPTNIDSVVSDQTKLAAYVVDVNSLIQLLDNFSQYRIHFWLFPRSSLDTFRRIIPNLSAAILYLKAFPFIGPLLVTNRAVVASINQHTYVIDAQVENEINTYIKELCLRSHDPIAALMDVDKAIREFLGMYHFQHNARTSNDVVRDLMATYNEHKVIKALILQNILSKPDNFPSLYPNYASFERLKPFYPDNVITSLLLRNLFENPPQDWKLFFDAAYKNDIASIRAILKSVHLVCQVIGQALRNQDHLFIFTKLPQDLLLEIVGFCLSSQAQRETFKSLRSETKLSFFNRPTVEPLNYLNLPQQAQAKPHFSPSC